MKYIARTLLYERLVSRLATDASTNSETSAPATQPLASTQLSHPEVASTQESHLDDETVALEEVEAENKAITRNRITFYSIIISVGLFMFVTAMTGLLVRTDVWASLLWVIPVAIVVAPIILGMLRRRPLVPVLGGLLLAIVVAAILFITFLLVVFSGIADEVFAFVVGNEAMGSLGIAHAVASVLGQIWLIGPFLAWLTGFLGWVINLVLVFGWPTLMVVGMIYTTSVEEDFSILWALVLAVISPLAFVLIIGQPTLINSGF